MTGDPEWCQRVLRQPAVDIDIIYIYIEDKHNRILGKLLVAPNAAVVCAADSD